MSAIATENLRREFPGVVALQDVNLRVEPGEVHGIIGENGAGKSTLMRLLSGVDQPSAGRFQIFDTPGPFRSVHAAEAAGVAMIHQELNLIPELTVADNIFLGREPHRFGRVQQTEIVGKSQELLGRVGASFSPTASVGSLSLAERQLVEIAKALSVGARVLIMDEPTAVLSQREVAQLHRLIRELRDAGTTVLYISHLLGEVLSITDRVTVLRDGQFIGTCPTAQLTEGRMASLMVGRELAAGERRPTRESAEALLEVGGSPPLTVRAGEIVGFGGLIGAGRTEMAEAIAGFRRREFTVRVGGSEVPPNSPTAAIDAGIVMVNEDRKGLGLHLDLTIRENVVLPSLRERSWRLDPAWESSTTEKWRERLRVRMADQHQRVGQLSGGNQQKISLAKWLQLGPQVLILDEPTRGVDIGAKGEIYALVRELADQGMACLVISSDMAELLQLSDRVIVFREGNIVGELSGTAITEDRVMQLAAGVDA